MKIIFSLTVQVLKNLFALSETSVFLYEYRRKILTYVNIGEKMVK